MNILNRIQKLKNVMEWKKIDCTIIFESRNVYYFSDTGQHCILLIPLIQDPILFVRRDFDRAKKESPIKDIRLLNKTNDVFKAMKELGNLEAIGVEMDSLRVRTYQALLKVFDSVKFDDLSNDILYLRSIKDKDEIEFLKKSAKVAEKVQEVSRDFIKPGVSELDLAGVIQGEITKRGSIFAFFNHYWARNPFVIASGENLWGTTDFPPVLSGVGYHKSYPHSAGDRIIKDGDIVVVDVAPVINGYTSDHGRTYFVGNPTEKFKEAYDVFLKAYQKALERFKDGAVIGEIYATIEENLPDSLKKFVQGFDNNRVGMGHGIGLSLDELPFILKNAKGKLEVGNVIAFEPKIVVPGWGAIDFEDDFVITKNGYEQITNSPFYEF